MVNNNTLTLNFFHLKAIIASNIQNQKVFYHVLSTNDQISLLKKCSKNRKRNFRMQN